MKSPLRTSCHHELVLVVANFWVGSPLSLKMDGVYVVPVFPVGERLVRDEESELLYEAEKHLIPRGLRRDVLKEVSQGATKIPSMGLASFCSGSESESLFLIGDLLRLSKLAVESMIKQSKADELYRVPAVTGSNLLSPGPEALVPIITVVNHVL
ncbi:hypothetical protein PIB30_070600 [Stylosanthes scabra]|uniref:Uncharacterized protein n=1 Tax=Stylosanthes scabra TaxID=79078 RepID=A0ABU6RP06_9FABA|nr:hypothetical protein [Stylosanthes scabra]